jgi:hypothetical protein
VAGKKREPKTDICMTVQKDGVWIYGNPQAFRRLAEQMARLAASVPAEHYELHMQWHLGSHRTKRNAVFILMDKESRSIHKRDDFEVTFMVVEPSDPRRLRRHERSGQLPRKWSREA